MIQAAASTSASTDVALSAAEAARSSGADLAVDVFWRHSWPWPIWVAVVLFAAAATVILWSLWREAGLSRRARLLLIGLRTALLALLMFMMFGWWISRYHSAPPDMVLILDDSRSMAHVDGYEAEVLSGYMNLLARVRGAASSEDDPAAPGGEGDGPSRWALARAWLLQDNARRLRSLNERFRIRAFLAGEDLQPLPGEIDALIDALSRLPFPAKQAGAASRRDASRLGEAVREVMQLERGRPAAAVLLVSDGVVTSGPLLGDAARRWRRRDTPWFCIGMGLEGGARDLALSDLLAPPSAFVGDLVAFQARLDSSGFAGESARVLLFAEGESQPRAEQQVTLNGERQTVELSCRVDDPGEARFRLQVAPLEGEATVDNNSQQAAIQVRDEAIRVLLIEGAARWEYRMLKFLLSRAVQREGDDRKSIDLKVVLQQSDAEYLASEPTALPTPPVTAEEFYEYDVVILGDADPGLMTRATWTHLKSFVEDRGGGLAVIAGENFNPLAYRDTALAELLPVRLETASAPPPGAPLDNDFIAEPTSFGATFAALQVAASQQESMDVWRSMPPLRWLVEAGDLRPGCWSLLQHPSRRGDQGLPWPVVSLRFAGAGKVLFHATDESYRWARHEQGAAYFERYWLQMLRYLSRAKLLGGNRQVELTTDRELYRGGDPVRLRTRFLDERQAPVEDQGVEVMVEDGQGRRRRVQLSRLGGQRGVFEANAEGLEPGKYRAWLIAPVLDGDPPAALFEIQQPQGELARLEMDAEQLRQVAQATGGAYLPFRQADAVWDRLPAGRRVQVEPLPPQPLWNSSILAGLFVVIMIVELILRKRWDLY